MDAQIFFIIKIIILELPRLIYTVKLAIFQIIVRIFDRINLTEINKKNYGVHLHSEIVESMVLV